MVEETLSRGVLFEFSDNLHYAYGEIGQSLQTFTVDSMMEEEEKEDLAEIVINGQMYYTDFSCLEEIPKKSIMESDIIAKASEEEVVKIRDQKKQFARVVTENKKRERKQKKKASLEKVGDIVEDYTAAHHQSIVVYQKRTELIVVDREKYENDDILSFHYLQSPQVKKVSKMNTGDLKTLLLRVQDSYTKYLTEQEKDTLVKKFCNDAEQK